jgi:hypothetical protein
VDGTHARTVNEDPPDHRKIGTNGRLVTAFRSLSTSVRQRERFVTVRWE